MKVSSLHLVAGCAGRGSLQRFSHGRNHSANMRNTSHLETGSGGVNEPAITMFEPAFKAREHLICLPINTQQNTWQQTKALEIAEQQRFESGCVHFICVCAHLRLCSSSVCALHLRSSLCALHL